MNQEEMIKQLGLIQVKIPLPFRLNHIYCYLSKGKEGWTIIDAGLNREETMRVWRGEMSKHQFTPEECRQIIITHYHPDHYGAAGGLQELTGAVVKMSETDRDMGRMVWTEENVDFVSSFYHSHGIPEELLIEMKKNVRGFFKWVKPHPEVEFLSEGDKVKIGDQMYQVYHLPGHSEGHLCFYQEELQVLIGGDVLLPKITPNISIMGKGDPNPLETYLRTLDKLKRLNISFVIPAHGQPFTHVKERIEEIKKHHETRLQYTLDLLPEGGSTVYEICRVLFPQTLTVHEIRFAIGETLSHLEYLVNLGKIKKEFDRGEWKYMR
ncbi:MBL fold metallo-hydrolase [Microaerobacter geothermalis]|uniref:MBL fold metallo-hydrolase n=1 Tax=Microaerobacter geothermalis TaxID=674972 RepID=UPI001F3686E2|nr:MBL fold metallo-hydrolase [Microaerobacter geothermalis]MCF6092987.1 MBL fold metallo-hydrolase [Microaerobacter geothermalis]